MSAIRGESRPDYLRRARSVAYVIVEGPKNAKLGDVIEDPAYVAEKGLRIDYNAYYERQLKTPLLELFEVCGARGALDATVTVARSVDKKTEGRDRVLSALRASQPNVKTPSVGVNAR